MLAKTPCFSNGVSILSTRELLKIAILCAEKSLDFRGFLLHPKVPNNPVLLCDKM